MRLALGLGTRPTAANGGSSPAGQAPSSHDSTRQRRRFAQDGDVPVVMLHRGRDGEVGGENRLAALTTELREERTARLKADRALEENQGLVNSLRTKLKHAEMALDDKLRAESEARVEFDQLLVQEREARQRAEARAADAELALSLRDRQAETAQPKAPQPVARRAAEPKHDPFRDIAAADEAAAGNTAAPKRRGRRPKVAAEAAPETDPAPLSGDADGENREEQPIEWWLPSFRATRKAPPRRKHATG